MCTVAVFSFDLQVLCSFSLSIDPFWKAISSTQAIWTHSGAGRCERTGLLPIGSHGCRCRARHSRATGASHTGRQFYYDAMDAHAKSAYPRSTGLRQTRRGTPRAASSFQFTAASPTASARSRATPKSPIWGTITIRLRIPANRARFSEMMPPGAASGASSV